MAKGWDFDPSSFVGMVEEDVGKTEGYFRSATE